MGFQVSGSCLTSSNVFLHIWHLNTIFEHLCFFNIGVQWSSTSLADLAVWTMVDLGWFHLQNILDRILNSKLKVLQCLSPVKSITYNILYEIWNMKWSEIDLSVRLCSVFCLIFLLLYIIACIGEKLYEKVMKVTKNEEKRSILTRLPSLKRKKILIYFIYFTGILEKDSKSTNIMGMSKLSGK